MRVAMLFVATFAVLAGPVLAQTTPEAAMRPAAPHKTPMHRATTPARSRMGGSAVDGGPFTPEANRAYQGGGVVLEGAPGAPAPVPQATPPGQMPKGAVPPMQ